MVRYLWAKYVFKLRWIFKLMLKAKRLEQFKIQIEDENRCQEEGKK